MIKSWCCLCFCLLLLLGGCNRQGKGEREPLSFSPFVEAFTSGTVSRNAPVYLVFSQAVDTAKMDVERLSRAVHIKPEVAGTFAFEGDRTIVFRPATGFERDTRYRVTADLSEWFDVGEADRSFAFDFQTFPLSLRAEWQSLDVNQKNENGYDLCCTLFTPDRETPETVESLVGFSEKVETVWQHSPDGKRHEIRLVNVQANAGGMRKLILDVEPNKWGVKEENLLVVNVPGISEFGVYDVRTVSEPERFIEITFSQLLDKEQNMQGLAWIDGNRSDLITVEGNKLRLYPDKGASDVVNVHLNQQIRSKSGQTLQTDVVRQVHVNRMVPAVRFIGKGVIIPQSAQLTVPFQAVYLRGVVVRVIKILEQNIGSFLQMNDLDGTGELMRVGRLVARKTIFLDDDASKDLSKWNTYAIDLSQLIEPEPGAIYRVELSFNKELSAYPCADDGEKMSKEQIWAQDEIKFREESSRFDEGGYYYSDMDLDWSDYRYQERDDPCSNSFYYNKSVGKNVLATNLGLMAVAGTDKEMLVCVHNLQHTKPEKGVRVTAYNFQHQELASGVTDSEGQVQLSLVKGKPFYVIASLGKQRSYLRVDGGSALSLSSFDVDGEVVQEGIKGFIYGERGVWRPGDTLHIGFMLQDRLQTLPANHPVIMELYNPLGQLYLRQVKTDGELGVYAFALPTDADAPTGAWRVEAYVGGATFTKRIRLETIKPNRLKIALTMPRSTVLRGEPLNGRMHVEWLQGATAHHLKYDIQATFVPMTTTFSGFSGYCFDNPSKVFGSEESKLITGTTDGEGNAVVDARLEVGNSAPGMLLGNLVTRVYEESGDFSLDATRVQYAPYKRYVGILSPQQGRKQLNTGEEHLYRVASVSYAGKPEANVPLDVNVYKVNWYWWWEADPARLANFVSEAYNKPVKTFALRTDEKGLASFSLSFADEEWGTYFVEVKDKESKHSTGVMSYFDWASMNGRRDAAGASAASMLSFKTDKSTYAPGEKMFVTFPSGEGSRAVICIMNGTQLLSVKEHACASGQTTVQLDVTPEMQPNAYVHITLLQPHSKTNNDLPIRMYGVVPFTVTSPESRLEPVIRMTDEIKPEAPYQVTVSEKQGREMAYTLAVVDEGLLDLTRFQTPDAWAAFNAREALGVQTWDLYNYVVGAYGGRIEQLFSIGGDEALNKGPKAIVNRFKPVVQFVGPFLLKKGETRKHTFQMPNYNGRVRVMVVAGDGKAYGNAEKSVMVRKPVMLLGTLPRVIGVNEEMVVPATVFATEKGVGDVQVSISCSPNMEVVGATNQSLRFQDTGDQLARFRIRVKDTPGVGQVTLTASGKGERSVYQTDLEIRTVRRPQTQVTSVVLEPGELWQKQLSLPGVEGTNQLTLEVSGSNPINLSARLSELLAYPHGCLEQLTSKAFPLLYLKQLATLDGQQEHSAEETVKDVIRRLRSYQTADGAFAYWPGATSSHAWGTVYACHFLLEAERKGYFVPEAMKKGLLSHLLRTARSWKSIPNAYTATSEEITQAYRLFVLALGQESEMGAMNRLKEKKTLQLVSRQLLASAYAQMGRTDVAKGLLAQTEALKGKYGEYDQTFGSELRDRSIALLTYLLVGDSEESGTLAREVAERLASDEWLSTQSIAFALVAYAAYMEKYPAATSMDFTYTCEGKSEPVSTSQSLWVGNLLEQAAATSSVALANKGKSTLFARWIAEGTPAEGQEQAYANGLSLAVSYVDMNGKPVQVDALPQGTNFAAVVTVRNVSPRAYQQLALTELFPAGWEILNTRYLNGGQTDSTALGVSYQDIRDDRVYTYIDRLPAGRQLTVRINLCAVYPGRFYLPPVYCEAMYDHTIRANTEGRQVTVE